jgi:nitrate/nitrite transport system substrate-binding protein
MKRTISIAILGLMAYSTALRGEPLEVEKDELKFGFIKLTDCAPLVIAKEKGFFDDEGLNVQLEPQANWKVLLDRVITGELDGAHMLACQPIGATIGIGTQAHVVTASSFSINGIGITVSNNVWEQMEPAVPKQEDGKPKHPISAQGLKPATEAAKQTGNPLKFGITFPVSTHNYDLRYWLAAGGINPGYYYDPATKEVNNPGVLNADVILSVTPPPQMPSTMEAGTIVGYCVGEPWNQQAVAKKIGVPVATNYDLWKNKADKIFGVTAKFADENPQTYIAVTKALIRAGQWLDASPANRKEAVKLLSRPNYVGADEQVLANSMTGTFEYEAGDRRPFEDFNIFFRNYATYPWVSENVWFLTQMVRWGQVTEPKGDEWYAENAKKVVRPDVYEKAAKLLVEEYPETFKAEMFPFGTDGYRPPVPAAEVIDGKAWDGRKPSAYVQSFEIGLK